MVVATTVMEPTSHQALLDSVLKQFRSATSAPEIYLRLQEKKAEKHKLLVKNLFDLAKAKGGDNGPQHDDDGLGPDELIIEDMDEEQIWQQLELQNETMLPRCLKQTSKLLSTKEDAFKVNLSGVGFDSAAEETTTDDEDDELDEEELDEETDSDDEEEDEDEDSADNDGEDQVEKSTKNKSNRGRPSEVDDKFFKLSEMEEFLEAEDRKEMLRTSGKLKRTDDDDLVEIDYFKADDEDDNEEDDDDDEEDYNYENFFGDERNPEHIHEEDSRDVRRSKLTAKNEKKKKSKKRDLGLEESDVDEDEAEEAAEDEEDGGRVKFDLSKNTYRSDSEEDKDEEDDDDDEDNPPRQFDHNDGDEEQEKSTFEHRQERLRLRIQDMEDQVMGEKSWQLRGEIDSGSRPQNSLLENVLEFDSTVRPAPIITEETTLQLEDIIKQRIKDKAWNDVERKFKPANTPQEFRKKLVLDQEKSKASLAQIYEQEYLKEVEKLNPNTEEREAEEPKEHKEIRTIMKGIFAQLDALANFSYTPKVAAPEVRIITNTPAINMEEVAPIAVSDAALLAPEEVMPRTKGDAIGKSERSETDKKRERRQKKVKQRQIQAASERKEAEKAAKGIVSSTKVEKKKLLEKVTKSRNVTKMKESTDGKSIKSSKQFFSQLQDEVSTVKTAIKSKGKRKTVDAVNQANAKKFKL